MRSSPIFVSSHRRPDPVPRILSSAAVLIALTSLVFSMSGLAPAKQKGKHHHKHHKALNLKDLRVNCPIPDAVDLGTWCMQAGFYPVPPEDTGKNSYAYAAQKCVEEGGWLPSAAQLIGAAPRVKLASTIDDSILTSGIDQFPDPKNGIKDTREMSGDLTTTASGGRAAGSEGVTVGSKGNGNLGEPDPVPMPADPFPDTLDYVTVYDNHNLGGFAGGEPVGAPEKFRCAFAKGSQGTKFGD